MEDIDTAGGLEEMMKANTDVDVDADGCIIRVGGINIPSYLPEDRKGWLYWRWLVVAVARSAVAGKIRMN